MFCGLKGFTFGLCALIKLREFLLEPGGGATGVRIASVQCVGGDGAELWGRLGRQAYEESRRENAAPALDIIGRERDVL